MSGGGGGGAAAATAAKVGSAPWLRSERASIKKLCAQDTEDFVFSARQDVEWLNEHMAEVLAIGGGVGSGRSDLAELLKTPRVVAAAGGKARQNGGRKGKGKVAGKITRGPFTTTPRRRTPTAKETSIVARNTAMLPPPLPVPAAKPTTNDVEETPKEIEVEEEEERVKTIQTTAEATATRKSTETSLGSVSVVITSQNEGPVNAHAHPQRVSKPDSTFRDSGNWSQSSGMPSQQHTQIMGRPRSPRKAGSAAATQVDEDSFSAAIEAAEEAEKVMEQGDVTLEDVHVHEKHVEEAVGEVSFQTRGSSPFEELVPVREHAQTEAGIAEGEEEEDEEEEFHTPSHGRAGGSDITSIQQQQANATASPVPTSRRRSTRSGGSNATARNSNVGSTPAPRISSETASVPAAPSTPSVGSLGFKAPADVDTRQVTPSPLKASGDAPNTTGASVAEPDQYPMTPAGHDDGDSPPENMDEPSPVPAFLRKSSLSFASLPPREPLGGGRASTASATTETVRLNGVGRSSWLAGRRTLGRSLGGRLTMGDAVIGEDGEETPPKQPSVPAPAERKRSRGADEMSVDPQQPRQPQPEEPAPEAQAKPAHRKKSRSASYRSGDEEASLPSPKETAVESPRGAAAAEESDSSTRLVAKHNKMASQRLQEKILMLGKLSAPAAREGGSSHSTPVEAQDSTAPVYPDLTAYTGQTSAQQSSPAPPPPAVQQQPELTLTRGSRDNSPSDDEWIPPVRPASTKPLANKQFQKSRVAPGLSRSQTVPAHASPRNPAKDYLPRKGADDEMDIDEDENTGISRPKTARGDDAEAPKAISYPKSLGFHAINSPLGAHSARASGSPDRSSPITKTKSFSSLKKSNSTTDSPTGRQPRAVVSSESFKTQTMSAFNRAKAMFTQANNNSETTPVKASEKGSPAPEEGDTPVRTPQGSLRHRKEGLYPNLGPGSSGAKPRRNPRGSKGKEVSQRQQEEAEAEARRAEAQRLQEEEEEKQRLAEQQRLEEQRRLEEEEARIEKERRAEEERNARRVEEQRRQAEVRRREKEQQRKLQEEEAARQREKEEARKKEEEEYLRKQRELLQRKEDELRKIQEEQRAIVRRKEEERLRQQKEEELRNWQEAEERARIEDEERIRKEEEEEERRQAEEARLDELRRRQEEDIRRQQEADKRRAREITPVAAEDSENDETSKPARPKSAMGRPPSRIQPPSGGKRPLRPAAQKVERSKPQPVSIQIGTASQRAALDRHKTGPTPSSTLLSAMEKSFSQSGRPPSAEPSLHSSASAPQLKKSNSSTSVSSQARVKSLENAAQTVKKADMDRKREEHKKAIEARREEIRRKEALLEEEKRKAAAAAQGRRPIDKDPEPKKTLSKATGMKGPTSANKMMNRIAPVPKRAYQAEEEAAAAMPPPAANPATASTYGNRLAPPKQPDSKKRKTEEWDQSIAQFEQALASSSSSHTTTTKAPVRPSAVKRDWPAKITYAQGYNTVPSATQSGMGRPNAPVDPTVKMATANHAAAKTASGGALHVDGVIKYSNEKIRFANEAIAASSSNTSTFTTTTTTTTMVPTNSNPSTSLTSNTSNTTSTTPAGVKKKSALKTPNNNPKEKKRVYTPMLGDGIELPDIPTDSGETDSESSDPDSSNEGGKDGKFSVPHWAESPELRQALYAQQTMDPEHVFGPMAPLHMDEIFRSRSGRFRARSSSANWSGADRLTTAEIEADAEARRRMIENGGWIYGNMNGL